MLKNRKILRHRGKDAFFKIGQVMFYLVVVIWLTWHLVSIQQNIVQPVKLSEKPVGYSLHEGNCYKQISYVRIKNRSIKAQHVRLELSSFDTDGKAWKYNINKMEPWNLDKTQRVEINEDKTIVIPGKSEIGLYLEADRISEKEIFFPIFVKQEIQIHRLK